MRKLEIKLLFESVGITCYSKYIMNQIPLGELVKIMERGVITLPAKYRRTLGLKKGELVQVVLLEKKGLLVVPVEIGSEKRGADWTKDSADKYLAKVRYSQVEKNRVESLNKAW